MNEKIIQLLLHSLDHELTEAEQLELGAALEASAELRAEQKALLEMRAALTNFSVEADPAFVDDLMQQLPSEKTVYISGSIRKLFPKVAAACVLVLLLSVLSIYFTEGNLSVEAIVGIQDLSPEDAYSYLDY